MSTKIQQLKKQPFKPIDSPQGESIGISGIVRHEFRHAITVYRIVFCP